MILMVSVTMSVWSARVWMSEPGGGLAALVCALTVFRFSVLRFREGWRLASLAALEEWIEHGGSASRL